MTLVTEFHAAFGLPRPQHPPLAPDPDDVKLRMRLIREEFEEVMAELGTLSRQQDKEKIVANYQRLLKELCDLIYVTEGTAVSLGLPIDAAFEEVHRSNMTKLGPDGLPVKNKGGKVVKGPNYEEANMKRFVPDIITIEETIDA